MTVTVPDSPHEATGLNHPVAEALRTQETFDRAQVAWLMSEAMRWGYELRDAEDCGWLAGYNARVAEENQAWPPPKVFLLGRWYDQATERAKADSAARLLRPTDFKGITPLSPKAAA
jgi:hypothetical protein